MEGANQVFLHMSKKLEIDCSSAPESQTRVKRTDGASKEKKELQNGFRGAILALELAAWQVSDSQKLA